MTSLPNSSDLSITKRFFVVAACATAGQTICTLGYCRLAPEVVGVIVLAVGLIAGGFLDVPIGLWLDRVGADRGARLSFACFVLQGTFALAAGLLGMTSKTTLTEIQSQLGAALILGSDLALTVASTINQVALNKWAISHLQLGNQNNDNVALLARKRLITNVTQLVTGLLFFSNGSWRTFLWLPYLVSVGLYLTGCWLTANIKMPAPLIEAARVVGSRDSASDFRLRFRGALANLLRNARLRWLLAIFCPFYTIGLIFTYYWQDIFKHVQSSETSSVFMALWLAQSLSRFAGSGVAYHYKSSLRARLIVLKSGSLLVAIVPILLLCLDASSHRSPNSIWGMLVPIAFCLSLFGQEMALPLFGGLLHNEVSDESHRATMESLFGAGPGLLVLWLLLLLAPFGGHPFEHRLLWAATTVGVPLALSAVILGKPRELALA